MRARTFVWWGAGLVFVIAAGAAGAARKAKPPLKPRYIDNRIVRLGVDLGSGGSVFYFAQSSTQRNLLNHRDLGRFVQQSYYGRKDGSVWAKKPWRWNPVQGGDYKGHPARLVDSRITPTSVYTRSVPKNWAGGQDIEDAVMEEWIRLRGRVAHIRFRFTYTGAEDHPPRHQELPAVFVDYDLPNLVFYRGDAPWTGGKLTRVVPGWPNEPRRADECWAAYVDQRDWGIGVFFPGTSKMTTYRHKGRGDGGPKGTACSYFAPVRTLAIKKGFTFEYDVYLTIGKVNEIRERFGEIHSRRRAARPARKRSGAVPKIAVLTRGASASDAVPTTRLAVAAGAQCASRSRPAVERRFLPVRRPGDGLWSSTNSISEPHFTHSGPAPTAMPSDETFPHRGHS